VKILFLTTHIRGVAQTLKGPGSFLKKRIFTVTFKDFSQNEVVRYHDTLATSLCVSSVVGSIGT
jgi:hypothetical protein